MKYLLLFAITYLSFSLNAQINIDKIDLNRYKTTDYEYKSLGFSAAYGGNTVINNKISRHNERKNKYNLWANANSIGLNIRYNLYKNTRRKQLSRSLLFSTKPYYKFGNDTNDDKTRDFRISNELDYIENNRTYINNRFFFYRGLNIYCFQDLRNFTIDKYDYHNIDISVKTPFMIGWGRIEVVSNAWKAYRIIQDLNSYNLLNENSSFDEQTVFKIADYITNRNFTRAFDYREKFKEDMIGLTNTFFKNNADISNPIYYASLYDMWSHAINNIRQTGSAFSVGLQPEIHYNYDMDNRYNNNSKVTNIDLFLIAKYEKYKALSINWQLDFVGALETGIVDLYYHDNSNHHQKNRTYFSPSVQIGLGYYPNTRTSFNSTLNTSIVFDELNHKKTVNNSFRFYFENTLNYYISPKIRLTSYLIFNFDDRILSFGENDVLYSKSNTLRANYGIKYN